MSAFFLEKAETAFMLTAALVTLSRLPSLILYAMTGIHEMLK